MKHRKDGGFTLVELVFGAVIMALMVGSIGQLYISNLNTVVLGKARAIGVALVNEKMETLRDLPYDSVATQHGVIYPPGNVLDDETTIHLPRILARRRFSVERRARRETAGPFTLPAIAAQATRILLTASSQKKRTCDTNAPLGAFIPQVAAGPRNF